MSATVCRACLKTGVKMKSLFAIGIIYGKEMSLKEVLLSCANLEISQKDGFPQNICVPCIIQIEKAYSFRVMCEKNQETLKEQSEGNFHFDGDALVEDYIDEDNGIIAKENEQNDDEIKQVDALDKMDSEQNIEISNSLHLNRQPELQLPQSNQKTSNITKQAHAIKQYGRYMCRFCNMSYKLKPSLELHIIRNHSVIPKLDHTMLICNICKKRCKSPDSYKRHMNFHKTGKQYHCDECGRDFSQHRSYVCHRYSHTGERPVLCTECGKGFKTNVDLAVHMRVHLNIFPYICKICGEKFRYSSRFTMHKRKHAGEKPFECPFCDMKFICGAGLKLHKRTHTGEKPFPCKICGKAFARSTALKVHSQTHTGEKPHICSKCNKGFSQAHCLRSHMKLHEKELVEENNESQIENEMKFEAEIIIEEIQDLM